MAIIIDTNCLANVFSRNSKKHDDFAPVLEWVINGKGVLVFGGTKYMNELRKTTKYMKIIKLLNDCKKVYIGNKTNIDKIQAEIEKRNRCSDFDDPHLPAIVIDTKCKLICSEDTQSVPHVKDEKWYPKHIAVPCFYTGLRNTDLLCDQYIDKCYKPLCKIKKEKKKLLITLCK